ncbi:hypothetical protein [Acinetobacter sp. YH12112]|uniref:hypothetical protein n=1 Tax=Acinetobacter sp. YH12112 TaxID=2601099 RepID=UPI0015D107E9|nr:hypothetical protein [Acinetobacter sp. YH12112]
MKLPNSISPAFIEWLDRGGHKITLKKNLMVITKECNGSTKRGVIPFERHEVREFYDLDDYLSGRYEVFLKQYLNNGKSFIDDLNWAMAGKYRKAVMMNNLAKVA